MMQSLRYALCSLYGDISSIKRVAEDAGLNVGEVDFSGSSSNVWSAVLLQAEKESRMPVLLGVTLRDFPSNKGLLNAIIELSQPESPGYVFEEGGVDVDAKERIEALERKMYELHAALSRLEAKLEIALQSLAPGTRIEGSTLLTAGLLAILFFVSVVLLRLL